MRRASGRHELGQKWAVAREQCVLDKVNSSFIPNEECRPVYVNAENRPYCFCYFFINRGRPCRHMKAVMDVISKSEGNLCQYLPPSEEELLEIVKKFRVTADIIHLDLSEAVNASLPPDALIGRKPGVKKNSEGMYIDVYVASLSKRGMFQILKRVPAGQMKELLALK